MSMHVHLRMCYVYMCVSVCDVVGIVSNSLLQVCRNE